MIKIEKFTIESAINLEKPNSAITDNLFEHYENQLKEISKLIELDKIVDYRKVNEVIDNVYFAYTEDLGNILNLFLEKRIVDKPKKDKDYIMLREKFKVLREEYYL